MTRLRYGVYYDTGQDSVRWSIYSVIYSDALIGSVPVVVCEEP